MSLGENIRKLREQLQWTLEDLSDRSGVELTTISALENRGSVRSKFAPQLAAALGVPLERLLSDDPGKPAPPHNKQSWPFSTPYSDYLTIGKEKQQQLDGIVAAFIAGALPPAHDKSERTGTGP